MRHILAITAAVALCCMCGLLTAQEKEQEKEPEFHLPGGIEGAVQTFERDCPMCGWDQSGKRSSDRPSRFFAGAFAPGTTCPMCGGVGKIKETINWALGYAQACGAGKPWRRGAAGDPGERKALELQRARRAAQLRATRNALRLLTKVRLDRGASAGEKTYRQAIQATVVGAEHSELKSGAESELPYYIAKATVPLWGVKGLTASLWPSYSKSYGADKHAGAPRSDLEEEYVVIIDARGTGCQPHLFPRIDSEKGTVVYDITKVNRDVAAKNGMAQYGHVKDDVPFDRLKEQLKQSCLDRGQAYAAAHGSPAGREMYAMMVDGEDEEREGKERPKKEGKKRRRRKRINVVVKGKKGDAGGVSVVVSEADAEKMKQADEKADSLKGGKVIILTDSRVAGKEGRVAPTSDTRFACRK